MSGTSFAREEQAIVDGGGQLCAAVRLARQRAGVGAAREWIETPALTKNRFDAAREGTAEQAGQFGNGEIEERSLALRFERRRLTAAEIDFNLWPAERSEVIDSGARAIRMAEQAALRLEFLRVVERQKQLV